MNLPPLVCVRALYVSCTCRHHRRWLVADGRLLARLDFSALVLQYDAKNYHVWTHRQWVVHVLAL